MRHLRFFQLLTAICFVSLCVPLANAQGRAECSVIKSEILGGPVRYCAYLPPSFDQDRGYQKLEQTLTGLGGLIKRVSTEEQEVPT